MGRLWLIPVIVFGIGIVLVAICFLGYRSTVHAMEAAGTANVYTKADTPKQPVPSLPETLPAGDSTPSVAGNNQTSQSEDTTLPPPPIFHSSVPCFAPMTHPEFDAYKNRVSATIGDDSKLPVAKEILIENCLSTEQIEIILNLFRHEETKLEWAKFAYRRSTDHENYSNLYDSLLPSSVSELRDYINDTKPFGSVSPIITGTESPGMPCTNTISASDFTTMKDEIEDEVSDESKLDKAKEQIGSKCLTVAQVEEVMNLFSFNQTKLDWAKFAYHSTSDTENYPDLYDALGSLSSKYDLMDYIESQQKQ